MATLATHSAMSAGSSSATPSISDLDGYSFRDYQFPAPSYISTQDEEFGFDPSPVKTVSTMDYSVYSPPTDYSSQWQGFDCDDDLKPSTETPIDLDAFEMNKLFPSTLPTTETAVSRFGQMTPPRSESTSSTAVKEEKLSPKSQKAETRKRSKPRAKDTESTTTSTATSAPTPAKKTNAGRKRKSTRKSSIPDEQGDGPETQKRKQSLEKNRVAAAKCRINKKEKTERLQRDSHEKAMENVYLKDKIMQLKDEIQHMNALLVAHANCDGCNSPERLQDHLNHLNALGNGLFSQQQALGRQNFGDFTPQMILGGVPPLPDNYFSGSVSNHMLHPPLPEFDRTAEFEVHTPLPTD